MDGMGWHRHRDAGGKRIAALTFAARKGTYGLDGHLWTDPLLAPRAQAMIGPDVALKVRATLEERMLTGTVSAQSAKMAITAKGGADVAGRGYKDMVVDVAARATIPLDSTDSLHGARLHLLLDGAALGQAAKWTLDAQGLQIDDTMLAGLRAHGDARRGKDGWHSPVDLAVERIVTDDKDLNAQLVRGHALGTLHLNGRDLTGQDLTIAFPHANLRFALKGRMGVDFVLDGTARLHGWPVGGSVRWTARGRCVWTFPWGPRHGA
jgi:translocation and assembly module TamB